MSAPAPTNRTKDRATSATTSRLRRLAWRKPPASPLPAPDRPGAKSLRVERNAGASQNKRVVKAALASVNSSTGVLIAISVSTAMVLGGMR